MRIRVERSPEATLADEKFAALVSRLTIDRADRPRHRITIVARSGASQPQSEPSQK
jgi:hypothetical protein